LQPLFDGSVAEDQGLKEMAPIARAS